MDSCVYVDERGRKVIFDARFPDSFPRTSFAEGIPPMRHFRLPLFFGTLLLIAAMDGGQDPNIAPEPEVLTRGPIHEAFANTANLAPVPGPLSPKGPPENIDELPPDQRPEGDNVQWIPGYFAWDDERTDYLWVSGFWRTPPPGRQWMPGAWRQTPDGHQWTSGFWADAAVTQVEYVPQPPPPLETALSVPAPGPEYTQVPGTWVYHETRYRWRPSFWCAYRPNWVYVPAHYSWTPCGYVFVDGYWDYPLRQRGVIFAPVYFGASFYSRPTFVYRPSYVIYDESLYGALFVRPGYSAYYFGDYFEARYTRFGYRSWIDVRIGGGYDPLYGYYRHHYAATPGWSVSIGNLYAGRYAGTVARPPRTFVQQNVVVNNIRNNTTIVNNNTTVVNNVRNVTMVAPLSKVDKTEVAALKPVTAAEKTTAIQSGKDVRQASVQRTKLETQAAVGRPSQPNNQANNKAGDQLAQQPLKLTLPKTQVVNVKPAAAPPPAPTTPPAQQKDVPKEQPKVQPKDQPKEQPKVQPKDQPKVQPKDQPKDQPKAPVTPQPKELPKVQPKDQPKDQPKTPVTPQPKEQPKLPPPLPKDQPKNPPPSVSPTPAPQPLPQPKSPPTPPPAPAPQPQPKAPPPAPAPQPQPKAPPPAPAPQPQPQPKAPPPTPRTPPPAPKTPPPKEKEGPKGANRSADRPG